jgi:DNA-binding beta-propeller fold protein YncE
MQISRRLRSRGRQGVRRRLCQSVALALLVVGFGARAADAEPFVYVASLSGSVSQYGVGTDGRLVPLSPPLVAAGSQTLGVAVSPNGRSVYATNSGDDTVSQYDVGADGALTPKTPATVAAGGAPVGVTVSPDGRSVYVTNANFCAGSVSQYDVGANGALTPKVPAAAPAGCHPVGVAVTPDGSSAYVTNAVFSSGAIRASVSQYDVGSNGALAPKTPASIETPSNPLGVAVSPDGRNVYVADVGDSPDQLGDVLQFDVGPGGLLAFKTPSSVPADDRPDGVAISPDGKSVYVTNNFLFVGGLVSQYDVGAGGALSPKSPATVAAGNRASGVAVSSDGKSVYVTNPADDTISQYNVGPGGTLGPKSPRTVTSNDPEGIALTAPPRVPTSKDQCKNGGWRSYGVFKNQGDCVSFVATKGKDGPAGSP